MPKPPADGFDTKLDRDIWIQTQVLRELKKSGRDMDREVLTKYWTEKAPPVKGSKK